MAASAWQHQHGVWRDVGGDRGSGEIESMVTDDGRSTVTVVGDQVMGTTRCWRAPTLRTLLYCADTTTALYAPTTPRPTTLHYHTRAPHRAAAHPRSTALPLTRFCTRTPSPAYTRTTHFLQALHHLTASTPAAPPLPAYPVRAPCAYAFTRDNTIPCYSTYNTISFC